MTPHYSDPLVTLYLGDCLDVMRELPDASVDSVVTDPPYGLEFMGKEWDNIGTGRKGNPFDPHSSAFHPDERDNVGGRLSRTAASPMRKKMPKCGRCGKWQYNGSPNAQCSCDDPQWVTDTWSYPRKMQAWHEQWATEAFRVLKPGGYLLAFGGTRTYHRLASAIEDAGFEIRDTLMWIYASGFPKSLDVSKALDKTAPRADQFAPFAAHLRERRIASGHKQKDVAKHFPSKTGGLTGCVANWELGYNVPTMAQWQVLRPMLGLSDEWRPLIERIEAEREKVGEKALTKMNPYAFEDGHAGKVDVTAPATDLARKWEGWGTALKPAHEPIVMARKPLVGTVAANVTRYGTGALNIDGTRIPGGGEQAGWTARGASGPKFTGVLREGGAGTGQLNGSGRWPSNVMLGDPELFDEPNPWVVGSGATTTSNARTSNADSSTGNGTTHGEMAGIEGERGFSDSGGHSRFFLIPKADRAERERGLAGAPKRPRDGKYGSVQDGRPHTPEGYEYHREARANVHPTVKPIDLMRHLVRLVTPPGGVTLDPFLGSGTTALAASEEGFRCIGIEREEEYLSIAVGRLMATPMGLGLTHEITGKAPPKTHPDLSKHQPKRRAPSENYTGGWAGTEEDPAA